VPNSSLSAFPRGSMAAIARLAGGKKRVRRKPRTDDDRALIARMALVEVERRIADGRLVRLGPREYEMRPRAVAPPSTRNATITS
jgi:hypothetical protein